MKQPPAPKARLASAARFVLPPIVVFLFFLVLWDRAVVWFEIKPYLVPAPVRVAEAARANAPELLRATWLSARSALLGLGLSTAAGLLLAIAFSQSGLIRRSFFPYAIFLQTVPIVAIAPLIITWFGQGAVSVVIVSFILSLFPIITNGTAGLLDVDPELLELFRLHRASRWQELWRLRLPNAVPYLVNGIRISSGLSVIGVIVGEFFGSYGGENFGLGYLIYNKVGFLETDTLFAAIFLSTLLGLSIFAVTSVVGKWLTRHWKEG